MSTNNLKAKEIKRAWHLIDAKNQILGRLSTEAAKILMGKNKPNYVPFLDCGDNMVIINASKVKVTGKKETQKKYVRHSGYPGGYKEETLAELREDHPERVIIHAVAGMLPKSKLGKKMIKKLHVYGNSEHPYKRELKNGTK